MKRNKPLVRKTPLKPCAFPRTYPKPDKAKNLKSYKWKRKPKKGADWYTEWGKRQTECHCCGISAEHARYDRFPGLSTHHIAKAGRVHTATNVLRLCQRCHDLAENLDTPVWLPDGSKWYYPKLTFAHCHWLKATFYPDEFDSATLTRLRMGVLTAAQEPPAVLLAERYARAGQFKAARAALAASDFPGSLDDLLGAKTQPASAW